MDIKERIQQDIAKLTVTEEVELLRLSLKEYMIGLNTYCVSTVKLKLYLDEDTLGTYEEYMELHHKGYLV